MVREAGTVSALMSNFSYSGAPLTLVFMLATGPAFYLGANPYIAIGVAFLLTFATGLVYGIFASAVPRSGGDYTWISRAFSPTLAFASNFSYMFWAMFINATLGTLVASLGLGPLLRFIAVKFSWHGALTISNWLVSDWGKLTVGVLLIAMSVVMLMLAKGLRPFLRLQSGAFVFWLIAVIFVPALVFLVGSKTGFIGHLNGYISSAGGKPHAYQTILKDAGPSPAFSLKESVLMATLPYYSFGFVWASAYWAGEMKRSPRAQFIAMPLVQVLTIVILIVVLVTAFSGLGQNFLRGMGAVGPDKYGLSNTFFYPELSAVASGSSILGVIILLGSLISLAVVIPINLMMTSRSLFAWSFDNVFPQRLAEVNPRTHTPLKALGAVMVVALSWVVIVSFNPSLGALVVLLGQTLTFACVGLAAMTFPYRQRDVFESSGFTKRIGNVPVMTLLGAVTFVTTAAMTTILLLDKNSGTSLSANSGRVILVAAVFLGAALLFRVIVVVQRSRGIDTSLAYRQIPPE
jgi:basic amino acid/polyamine antiporter, APA family